MVNSYISHSDGFNHENSAFLAMTAELQNTLLNCITLAFTSDPPQFSGQSGLLLHHAEQDDRHRYVDDRQQRHHRQV